MRRRNNNWEGGQGRSAESKIMARDEGPSRSGYVPRNSRASREELAPARSGSWSEGGRADGEESVPFQLALARVAALIAVGRRLGALVLVAFPFRGVRFVANPTYGAS